MSFKTFTRWLQEHEVHKKVGWQQSVSKGTREIDKSDLSDDYPDHLSNTGKVYPFKIVSSSKKGRGKAKSTKGKGSKGVDKN